MRFLTLALLLPLAIPAQGPFTPGLKPFIRIDAPVVALEHVRVIDGTGAAPLEDQTIVMDHGRIQAVGRAGEVRVPDGAERLALANHTVIPGLVGMHEHLFYPSFGGIPLYIEQGMSFPRLYLASGITTARTAGTLEPQTDLNLKKMIDAGRMPGPKMHITVGYLEGKGSFAPQMPELTGPDDARRFVEYWASQGAESFKAYMHITRAEMEAALAAAHAHGLKLTGHLCSIGFREAAALGVDNLEHGVVVDTEFTAGKEPDVCPPGPTGDDLAKLDMNGEAAQQTIRELVRHNVAVTSTLAVFEVAPPLQQRFIDALSPDALRNYLTGRDRLPDVARKTSAMRVQKELEFERAFVKGGGLLTAGCDPTGNGSALAGFGDQRNIELLVEGGFTPVEAIQIATRNGAKFLGMDDRIGSITAGKHRSGGDRWQPGHPHRGYRKSRDRFQGRYRLRSGETARFRTRPGGVSLRRAARAGILTKTGERRSGMQHDWRRRAQVSGVLLVFAAALLTLGWHVDSAGIAAAYSDPIARIRAQDEATYVASAIRMARRGDWTTPYFMGRPFLQKPPLLVWLAALSIRVLGLGLLAVRLPALVLGAAGVAAIYAWCSAARGAGAGILAAGLLLSSPFWQIFSRLCYTDIPSSACALLAMTAVAIDPHLDRRATPVLFGALGALSILAKSIAGLFPFAALALFWILLPSERRPRFTRLAIAGFAAFIVAAPWFLYQAFVHPQWLWADHVQVQLLGVGLQREGASLFNRPVTFYVSRMVQMDPIIALMAIIAIPDAIRRLRSRQDTGVLLVCCWTVAILAALAAFQTRNLPYLAFLIPPLCLLGVLCGPRWLWRDARIAAVLVVLLFAVRTAAHGAPWSLRPETPPLEGAAAMRAYYTLGRDTELLFCQPDDEFYSATLPLPRVRYCFVDPGSAIVHSFPHYVPLGIVITAEQFLALPSLLPQFEQRLREWRSDSTEPVATTITLAAPEQIAAIIRARPGMDFCLPSEWASFFGTTHDVRKSSGSHVFLLSRMARRRPEPIPALPRFW
ncbi:MAG: amidohydrolase family protein [Bryobacteraceae bacterium]